jgi:hypothetical protein
MPSDKFANGMLIVFKSIVVEEFTVILVAFPKPGSASMKYSPEMMGCKA